MNIDEKLMFQARDEYTALPEEERSKYLATLSDARGQDWVDAFTSFMETGDLQEFADAVGATAEFNSGVVGEPGISRAEGYERTSDDVAKSLTVDRAPVYEVVKSMAQQFIAAPEDTQEKMLTAMDNSKGKEFSQAVKHVFSDADFCEYIAKETQNFFDTLAKEFSEAKSKKAVLASVSDFSESVSNGLLDYVTTGVPSNASILEATAYLAKTAIRNFSECGELADALQELSDGALAPGEAEHMAKNIEDAVSPQTKEEIKDAAAVNDLEEKEEIKDMSEEDEVIQREKEQNNASLDGIVEKYKALQTPEAKAQMVEALRSLFDESLVEYILKRAEGEDFSEEDPEMLEGAPKEVSEDKPEVKPEVEEVKEKGDVDNYEDLASELLGDYKANPRAILAAESAPSAVSTLPEGSTVATVENGVTMTEGYQRDELIDQYDQMGFLN